jgi:putative aminopeptidase FrvX
LVKLGKWVALMVQVLELMKNEGHSNTMCGVATVMEEVGMNGATISVKAVNPDAASILVSDITDMPGITEDQSAVNL